MNLTTVALTDPVQNGYHREIEIQPARATRLLPPETSENHCSWELDRYRAMSLMDFTAVARANATGIEAISY
jgi:hypothetical protein